MCEWLVWGPHHQTSKQPLRFSATQETPVTSTAIIMLASVAAYLFLAGLTYGMIRKPTTGSYDRQNDENAMLGGSFWPIVWVGWPIYQIVSAGPRIVRAIRKKREQRQKAKELPRAEVVRR
jgi:hypothetical protein